MGFIVVLPNTLENVIQILSATEKPAVPQAQSCVVAQLLQQLPWLLTDLSSALKIP